MFTKSKVLVALLLACFVLLGGWLAYRTISANNHRSRLMLAQEIHKALSMMMGDLNNVKASSIQGVPADGKWYHAIGFNSRSANVINYRLNGQGNDELKRTSDLKTEIIANRLNELNFRRMPGDNLLLEVQIQAKNNLTLTSNFKIRLIE